MDCDYVIYDVPAEQPSNKWIVIHAGGCDLWTEDLGDWASSASGTNLIGLRPCMGLDSQTCTLKSSKCDALHVSWTMPSQPPQLGLGFNPPALIEVARNASNKLLFLHEFDGLPTYPWAHACNDSWPAYICVYSNDDDDAFDRKFYGGNDTAGIQTLLESLADSEYLPCAIEVIDARNSSVTPGIDNGPSWGEAYATNRFADLPCSGLFPQIPTQGWAWEIQGFITSGLRLAIIKEGNAMGKSGILAPFKQAIDIALGP